MMETWPLGKKWPRTNNGEKCGGESDTCKRILYEMLLP